MSLSAGFIRGLRDDPERIEAMVYLAECAERYPPGIFTPPLQAPRNDDREKHFGALAFHVGDLHESDRERITTVELCVPETTTRQFPSSDADLAQWLSSHVFTHRRAGMLYVCNGGRVAILDILITGCGPDLLGLGYTIEPCMGSAGISWMKVRKGKRTWTITTAETLAGVPLRTLLEFAQLVKGSPDPSQGPAEILYDAIGAYTDFLRGTFGTALRPTVGMIASAAARRCLPPSVLKWRPTPLLVAMEIVGKGYRGGVAYGQRFRGDVHRIDVNRQYTALLRMELPCDAEFSRWRGATDSRVGVFVCAIEADTPLVYPVGIWDGQQRRFAYGGIPRGRSICVLHTSEFPGLCAQGVRIDPGLGYAYRSTFSLGGYADILEGATRDWGRTSAVGAITKPLGNMVYGKFGQRPDRWELCYSLERPDDSWFPFFNDALEDVPGVWERKRVRYTSGMHVDIAAHITGAARSQLLTTWALLESYGYHVVRAHTDSITTTADPRDIMATDPEAFGAWKYEGGFEDSIIVGANAYSLDNDGHIAGIPGVTRDDLAELHAERTVTLSRQQRAALQGWERGQRTVTKTLTG